MFCVQQKPWVILAWNTALVAASFIGVHYLCYGLKDPTSYNWSLVEVVVTLLLALGYAHLYNKVSSNWAKDYSKGFVNTKMGGSHECGFSWTNFFNCLIFAILVSAIIITVMALAGVIVSTIYVDLLGGIRGAVSPLSPVSAASTAAQVGVATVVMELVGKTEGQPPHRTP